MSRFKAAGIHLILSAIIVLCGLAIMWFVWYPKGMFKLLGGGELLTIILGVDITLGPLLTLAVFNTAKKSLKMDLAIIGALQLGALIYGMSVMFTSRPVFNVLEEDRFKVTLASEIINSPDLAKAKKPEWQSLGWFGPKLVAAVAPTDPKEKERITISMQDWNMFPQLFVDYDSQRQFALKNAKPLSELRKNKYNVAEIDAFLAKHQRPEADFVYLPIVYSYTAMAAVLDAKNADFIEIINADSDKMSGQ